MLCVFQHEGFLYGGFAGGDIGEVDRNQPGTPSPWVTHTQMVPTGWARGGHLWEGQYGSRANTDTEEAHRPSWKTLTNAVMIQEDWPLLHQVCLMTFYFKKNLNSKMITLLFFEPCFFNLLKLKYWFSVTRFWCSFPEILSSNYFLK